MSSIFDKRIPKKPPQSPSPVKSATSKPRKPLPDVTTGALPKDALLELPNYYPIVNPITKRSEITLENAHRIAQADEYGKKTEAFVKYRIGDIPNVQKRFDSNPFVYTASALTNVLGMMLEPAARQFNVMKYFKPSKITEFMEYAATNTTNIRQNTMMSFGNYHEDNGLYNFIRHMDETLPMKVYQIGSFRKQLIKNTNVWFAATPDFLCESITIDGFYATGEIKSKCPWYESDTGYIGPWDVAKSYPYTELPYYYLPQFMLQMYVTGMHYGYFITSSLANGARISLYKRDEEYIEMILELLRYYHQTYVVEKSPFPKSGNPYEKVNDLYKRFLSRTLMLQQTNRKQNPFFISVEKCRNFDAEAVGKYNQLKRKYSQEEEKDQNPDVLMESITKYNQLKQKNSREKEREMDEIME